MLEYLTTVVMGEGWGGGMSCRCGSLMLRLSRDRLNARLSLWSICQRELWEIMMIMMIGGDKDNISHAVVLSSILCLREENPMSSSSLHVPS